MTGSWTYNGPQQSADILWLWGQASTLLQHWRVQQTVHGILDVGVVVVGGQAIGGLDQTPQRVLDAVHEEGINRCGMDLAAVSKRWEGAQTA